VDLAIECTKLRVSQDGHNLPFEDVRRRFERGWINFQTIYKPLADAWILFDTSGSEPVITDESKYYYEET